MKIYVPDFLLGRTDAKPKSKNGISLKSKPKKKPNFLKFLPTLVGTFLVIQIFSGVTSSLNTEVVDSSVINMIAIIPLLLVGGLIIFTISMFKEILEF